MEKKNNATNVKKTETKTETKKAPTTPKKIEQKKTEEKKTVLKSPTTAKKNLPGRKNNDANASIETIRDYMTRFSELDKQHNDKPKEYQNLKIGNCTGEKGECDINYKCMLHYLSRNDTFLAADKESCSKIISKYTEGDKKDVLKLGELLALSKDQTFFENTNFYYNLYYFNLHMMEYLFKDKTGIKNLKALDVTSKQTLFSNLREFAKQSLTHLTSYMDRYHIMDSKLLQSSYNLLYLMNVLTFHHANADIKIKDLNKTYAKMMAAVNTNINLFKETY